MSLSVQFDVKQFTDLLDLADRETRNACRRAVDRSARAARKEAIKALAADIGVKPALFRSATPPVRGSTAGSISASWTISKKRILIALTAGVRLPVRYGAGLAASTFRTTGGGSSHLFVPKSFVINVGGQQIVMVRRGKGRSDIKPIYAESPLTGMAQADGAARKVWELAASRELARQLPIEVAKAFAGERGSAGDVGNGE